MNGIHDMGGLHCFGRVEVEADEPVFHARWESRVFAITQALDPQGIYSLDEYRHAIELMDPADYLIATYYGRWLFALELILDRRNIVRRDETRRRIAETTGDAVHRSPLDRKDRNWPLPDEARVRWGALRDEIKVCPKFAAGSRVRVKNLQTPGHTRVAAYLRGHIGTVSIVNDQAWVLPDTRAHHRGENCQPVYNIAFEARELYGDHAEPNVTIQVDLSEDYLEAA